MNRPPLVEIEWIDSLFSEDGWQTISAYRQAAEAGLPGMQQRTAGFAVVRRRDVLGVAHSVSECGDKCAGVIFIPRRAVTQIRTLSTPSDKHA
jgi:hypothetical protein